MYGTSLYGATLYGGGSTSEPAETAQELFTVAGTLRTNIPVGNKVLCRFAFTTRELTRAEQITFLSGLGLPSATGASVPEVLADYEPPGLPLITVKAVKDAAGAYHLTLTVETKGTWRWRGRAVTLAGGALAATRDQSFRATRAF